MVIIAALLGFALWALAGYLYLKDGQSYDRHGGWSLLIIAPFMVGCIVFNLICSTLGAVLGLNKNDSQ